MQTKGIKKLIIEIRIIMATLLATAFVALFWRNKRIYMDKRARVWNKKMLEIVRAKHKIFNPYGVEFEPNRPYVIMSNHLSLYDIPLIFAAFPGVSIRMIAKKELYRIPVFGWGIKSGECISIDRKNPRQALKDLAIAREKMLSGIKIWIAPEGTRSRTGKMGEFKKGGFKLAKSVDAIIVPVAIVGSDKILPPGTFDFSVDETVDIHICKPIDTKNYDAKNMSKLMEDTATAIKKHL